MRLGLISFVCLVVSCLFAPGPAGADENGTAPAAEPSPLEDRFFEVILEEGDREEFEALPAEYKLDWRRRFWTRNDPTPTTDENQAETEHMRRVKGAIKKFRNRAGEFVWDERSKTWIRFGKPDRVEKLPASVNLHEGFVGARELWIYKDMLLWLVDINMREFYEISYIPFSDLSNIGKYDGGLREDVGRLNDAQLDFEESFDRYLFVNDYELEPERATKMVETGFNRWDHTRQINTYDYEGAEEFPFIFDVTSLAGSNGKTDVLIGLLIPLSKVEFERTGGIEWAAIQRRIALFDEDQNLIERKVENIDHEKDPMAADGGWMVTSESLAVDPGHYDLALRVVDLRSRNHGILKTSIEARRFNEDGLDMSDLLFANTITRDERGRGAFLRSGYRIVPRPLRVYAPGEDVTVYFEIYNLRVSSKNRSLYEVRYTLFGSKVQRFVSFFGGSSEGKLEPGISQAFQTEGTGENAARHISLDTSGLPEDRYTLIIEATDLATKEVSKSKGQFVIKR